MAKVGLFVALEAKAGKENEVDQFLRGALPLVQDEAGTVSWYAVRMDNLAFGIFDTFDEEAGRQAHLSGKVAEALFAKAEDLFSRPPTIKKFDVLADKVPE